MYENKNVLNEIFFADLDHEFIACPFDIILNLAKEKLSNKIHSLISYKCSKIQE
jgi:hypothetical protein